MAQKDFSDYFAAAYGNGGIATGMELGIKKWLADQELAQTKSTNELAIAKLGYDINKGELDRKFKERQEKRRSKEGEARSSFYNQRSNVFNQIFGGGLGGGNIGGNLPPGTTVSLGGVTMPLNRKYSDNESKTLSGAGALLSDLSELKNMFSSGKASVAAQGLGGLAMGASNIKGLGGLISGGAMGIAGLYDKGGNRQNYVDLSRNIANRLLYLRSGAQINEQEYKRFMAQLPALMRNDQLDVKQLDRFINEFSALQGRIESGALWDKGKKAFVGGEPSKSNNINLDDLFKDLEPTSEGEE